MMREAEHGNNVDFDDLADSAPCRSFEKKRHSQIVQLECLRSGIWGTKSLWGRVLTGLPLAAP